MKYVKEEILKDRSGASIFLPLSKEHELYEKELTTGALLFLIVDSYQPSQELKLSYKERKLQDKALNVLDKEPNEQGYWEFEDVDFEVMKNIVFVHGATLLVLSRFLTAVGKYLENAISELPKG